MTVVLIDSVTRHIGLSSDTKPTTAPAGSVFYETDTGLEHIWDGAAWQIGPGGFVPTSALLDQMVVIMGTSKTCLIPIDFMLSATTIDGGKVDSYGAVTTPKEWTAQPAASIGWEGAMFPSGLCSVRFDAAKLFDAADHADFSFSTAGVDDAFSLGCWIKMAEAVGTTRTLVAKYNLADTLREYKFGIDASGFPYLELYDETANAAEIATSDDAISPGVWQFVVATYNGVGGAAANAGISLYINGAAVSAMTLTDSGTYVDMDDTACLPTVGAGGDAAGVEDGYLGRMTLPFLCGKELTAANVLSLYGIGRRLIGLV